MYLLSANDLPSIDEVIEALLTKIVVHKAKTCAVDELFQRVVVSFPNQMLSQNNSTILQTLIQLYEVRVVNTCLKRLQDTTTTHLLKTNVIWVTNITYLIEKCSSTIHIYFSYNLLRYYRKSKIKSKTKSTKMVNKSSMEFKVKQQGDHDQCRRTRKIENPNVPQRRNSITNLYCWSIEHDQATKSNHDCHDDHDINDGELKLKPNKDNNSILHTITPVCKTIRRFLVLLRLCKQAFEHTNGGIVDNDEKSQQCDINQDESKDDNKHNSKNISEAPKPTQKELEKLYEVSRQHAQRVVIFFCKAFDVHNCDVPLKFKYSRLEMILALIIEFEDVLFVANSFESGGDYFLLGLLNILQTLIPDVAMLSKDNVQLKINGKRLQHRRLRVGQHCIKIWQSILLRQENFVQLYFPKNEQNGDNVLENFSSVKDN